MDDISYTAQWTAAARALENQRPDALFNDELAGAMAEPNGFNLLKRYEGRGVTEFIAIRTRYIDDSITRILAENGVRQVVLAANGMDTRAYRMDWPEETTVYELDHGALLTEKRSRLIRLGAVPRVSTVAVHADLTEDWLAALCANGFDPSRPTLWVAEGLVFFLTEPQATQLFETMATASPPKSWLVVDMTSATLLRHPMTQSFLARLRADGTPWQFGTDDPVGFLAGSGWTARDVRQPGEAGAGEGRWPHAVSHRDRPGVPRNWLISATATARAFREGTSHCRRP